jgi:hypothetical protein
VELSTAAAASAALACVTTAFGAGHLSAKEPTIGPAALAHYRAEVARFKRETWHWQRVMGVQPTRAARQTVAQLSVKQSAERWHRRLVQVRRRAQHPPHMAQFLCIHHYEASWTDAGSPYYGGLQMDAGFQQTYGGWLLANKGTADRWTPLEQIWAAEKAYTSRGFRPWQNTAALCGLL